MTRKKFAEALFDAIAAYRILAEGENSETWETCARFQGLRAALIYASTNGNDEIGHYILVEAKDGTMYRIGLERVLKLDKHEKILWEDLKAAEAMEAQEPPEGVDDSQLEDDED